MRVVSVALISALAIVTATGLFGVRSASAGRSEGSHQLTVDHAAVTRPGLATPFDITVRNRDNSPLPGELTIRLDSAYMAMFDENGLDPTPVASYQTGEWLWWTFENPDGREEIRVSFDARLEPGVQWGRTGSVAVFAGDDRLVDVVFRTWVIP